MNQGKDKHYYHGTSTALKISNIILPPCDTQVIQEVGRLQNLDKVFFTADLGSAKIYAGRAKNRFGGRPIVLEVKPVGDIEILNNQSGTTVFMAKQLIVAGGYCE